MLPSVVAVTTYGPLAGAVKATVRLSACAERAGGPWNRVVVGSDEGWSSVHVAPTRQRARESAGERSSTSSPASRRKGPRSGRRPRSSGSNAGVLEEHRGALLDARPPRSRPEATRVGGSVRAAAVGVACRSTRPSANSVSKTSRTARLSAARRRAWPSVGTSTSMHTMRLDQVDAVEEQRGGVRRSTPRSVRTSAFTPSWSSSSER